MISIVEKRTAITALVMIFCLVHSLANTDTIPPEIIAPAGDLFYECGDEVDLIVELEEWYQNYGGLTAEDDVSTTIIYSAVPDLETTLEQFSNSSGCGLTKSVTVSFFAADTCENMTGASIASFGTMDTETPDITVQAENSFLGCTDNVRDSLRNWVLNNGNAVASDDCSGIDWLRFLYNDSEGNTGAGFIGLDTIPIPPDICTWSVEVSFIVIDLCGNQELTTAIFTIDDNEEPFFSEYPQNITVNCDDLPLSNDVKGLDYCTTNPTIDYEERDLGRGNPGDCSYNNYTQRRMWTVTDECGNSSSHVQAVTVVDNNPPEFFIVDTIEIECGELSDPNASFLPTNVSDGCGDVSIQVIDEDYIESCSYEINRTYIFTDICGNSAEAKQLIRVRDSLPPQIIQEAFNFISNCENIQGQSFESWVSEMAGIIVEETCGEYNTFAAVPGSYDIDNPTTYPGEHPGQLDRQGCGTTPEGYVFYEEVDFVFYDECGNKFVRNLIYGITDNSPPKISQCPEDITIQAEIGDCETIFNLPFVDVEDNCIETDSFIDLQITEPLVSDEPGNENVPVNSLRLSFGPISTNYLEITDDGVLTVQIINGDINEEGEYLVILTESGDTLGFTTNTVAQCQSMTVEFDIQKEEAESWVTDGFINFFILNNNPGVPSDAINDICGGTSIQGNLNIPIKGQQDNRIVFVNGQQIPDVEISTDNEISLPIGQHEITYIIFDCAGNQDTCSYLVTVEDEEAPAISCPENLILNPENSDDCLSLVKVPFSLSVSDNCFLDQYYEQSLPVSQEAALLDFRLNENLQTYVARNILLSFENTPSITFNSSPAILEINYAASLGEGKFFRVLGEDGVELIRIGDGFSLSCASESTVVEIPVEKINEWSSDGKIEISFIASASDTISGGGINPCVAIQEEGTDGRSFLRATLRFSDARISYTVSGATMSQGIVDSLRNDTFDLELNAGNNILTLNTTDLGGNTASCSFSIFVVDSERPIANCKNAVIYLDPSGVDDYVLDPTEIDDGSIDNCGIDSMAVEPSVFSCEQLGEEMNVTLTVWDGAGNSSSCESTVVVRTRVLEPGFEIGVCDNDTLRLLANAPPTSVPDTYTFLWTGPDFSSVLENPVIPNATPDINGTYTLEITGFNGCMASGTVEVNVEELSSPVITTEAGQICVGDNILLTANGQSGNVTYNWYEGTFPNGLLLESTESPSLQISPTPGDHLYYLLIEKDGCESNPSPAKEIAVVDPPIATVIDEFITLCEGEPLVLGTEVEGEDYQYQWSGPGSYQSTLQYPDTILNSSTANEGTYHLIISLGGCTSDTASIQVTLFDKPVTPSIIAGDVYCEGSSISLSVNNVPNADLYTWFQNGEQFRTSTMNTLVINNAAGELSGEWSVMVTEGLCVSDMSEVKEITIESQLLISANNDGPGCEGDSLQLSVSFVPGANYSWTGPQGFQSSLQNPKISPIAGEYFVSVTTPAGCDGESSTQVEVITPPEITALSSDALECMDGMTDITFFPSVFPQGEYTYIWSGPGGYEADTLNPIIVNATEADNGTYTLTIVQGSCASEPQSIDIDITDSPQTPIIDGESNLCEGDTLMLHVEAGSDNVQYLWTTPLGQRTTTEPQLVVPFVESIDAGNYSIRLQKGNCRSTASQLFVVNVGSLPFQPSISSNAPICPGDTLFLTATTIRDVNYSWTGPNGFASTQQNPVIPEVSVNNEGVYQVTVNNGGCEISSSELTISIAESASPPIPESDAIAICRDNNLTTIELCIDPSDYNSNATYTLFNNDNDILIGESTTRCITIDDINTLNSGENFFYFRVEDEGCRSEKSEVVIVNINDVPIIDAEVEENPVSVCTDDPVTVTSLFGSPDVMVSWEVIDNYLQLSATDGKEVLVSGMRPGENKIRISYSAGGCMDFSQETVFIILEDPPEAANDSYRIAGSDPILLDVFRNDDIPGTATVEIITPPTFGTATVEDNGIRYTPDGRYIGLLTFSYEVCVPGCESECAQAIVSLNLGDQSICVAPTIITPNGDGTNDMFVVPCLYSGAYPDNRFEVYNQWGNTVYSTENYENDWAGTYNGKDLPVGTYYYVLDLGDGDDPIVGFLIIER